MMGWSPALSTNARGQAVKNSGKMTTAPSRPLSRNPGVGLSGCRLNPVADWTETFMVSIAASLLRKE